MEIKVIEFEHSNDLTRPKVLGKVKVLLGGKMFLWINCIMGKNRPFCTFPSFKRDGKYFPFLGWVDNDKMERTISDYVVKILLDEKYLTKDNWDPPKF